MFASTVYIYSLKKRVYCAEQNADRTSTLDIRALSSLIQRLDDDGDGYGDGDVDGDGDNLLAFCIIFSVTRRYRSDVCNWLSER